MSTVQRTKSGYQGRIFSRNGTAGTTTDLNDNPIRYIPLSQTSYGEPDGLFGINCGHQQYPFIPGVSMKAYYPYPEEQNAERYQQTQQQRAMERKIRADKRKCMMMQETGDDEGLRKAAGKLRADKDRYRDFCKETGLGAHMENTQVYGYDRSKSMKTVWAGRTKGSGSGGSAAVNTGVMNMVTPNTVQQNIGGIKGYNGGNALTGGGNGGIIKSDKQCILDAFTSGNHSDDIVDEIILHHKGFKDIDPAEMKKFLEDNVYNVKPLGGRSALKGIPFEQGGGYRAAFGGDAYFQYHPEEGSHHDGPYWKVSNGKRGDNRYDMEGKPKAKN